MSDDFLINIKLFANNSDENTHTSIELVADRRQRAFGECFDSNKNTPTHTHTYRHTGTQVSQRNFKV